MSDHIRELFGHCSPKLFDTCLVNTAMPSDALIERYSAEGAEPLVFEESAVKKLGVECFTAPLAEEHDDHVRHDPGLLAEEIVNIYRKEAPTRLFRRSR